MLFVELYKQIQTADRAEQLLVEAHVPAEGITAVYGRSGIGKSTFFNCLAGLLEPDQGKVKFGDDIWYDSTENVSLAVQQRNIGYIFQSNNLFPHLTVSENVRFALKKSDQSTDVSELLRQVELADMANRYPHQLSGGEQQKVAIARMLAQKSRLVLMDEPFSALDHVMRKKLFDLIKRFQQQYQLTILIATHDLQDIRALADHVLWIKEDRKGVMRDKEAFFKLVE